MNSTRKPLLKILVMLILFVFEEMYRLRHKFLQEANLISIFFAHYMFYSPKPYQDVWSWFGDELREQLMPLDESMQLLDFSKELELSRQMREVLT